MLNWNFENASLKTHGEDYALVKPDGVARSPLKIDGVICFVECIAMIDDPEIGSKIDIAGMIG